MSTNSTPVQISTEELPVRGNQDARITVPVQGVVLPDGGWGQVQPYGVLYATASGARNAIARDSFRDVDYVIGAGTGSKFHLDKMYYYAYLLFSVEKMPTSNRERFEQRYAAAVA